VCSSTPSVFGPNPAAQSSASVLTRAFGVSARLFASTTIEAPQNGSSCRFAKRNPTTSPRSFTTSTFPSAPDARSPRSAQTHSTPETLRRQTRRLLRRDDVVVFGQEARRPACGPVSPVAPRRFMVAAYVPPADQSLPYVELPSQESRIFLLVRLVGRLFKRWARREDAPPDMCLGIGTASVRRRSDTSRNAVLSVGDRSCA
jgi:hypothetical protein